jgi:hypothetical protein
MRVFSSVTKSAEERLLNLILVVDIKECLDWYSAGKGMEMLVWAFRMDFFLSLIHC